MAGYTRQSSATIIAGANVTAAIFNAEFNQLQSAFNGTTGHGHTGGTGDGPKLVLTAAASVSGILPLANGGTGYSTRIDAYDNFHIVASDIAVGSTVDLSTSDGDYIEVTGTGGTITSFGTCDIGVKRTLYFSGASNTITHNGTSLICPNGVNITVKAGEQLVVRSLGSGNWIVELLMKNSSAALGNLVLAADKLPYMSSTTAMSLADLTSFGRSLIDDADASTALSTLGFSTFGKTIIDDADAAAVRTTLGLPQWELITSGTSSAVSSLDITGLSAYRELKLTIQYLTVSIDTATLQFRVSTDNGSSYIAGFNKYDYYFYIQSSATGTSSGTFIPITSTSIGIGNSTNEFYNGTLRIFNFNQTIRTHLQSEATYQDFSTVFVPFRGYGQTADASAFNAFRILPSSGTITVTYFLEGLRG